MSQETHEAVPKTEANHHETRQHVLIWVALLLLTLISVGSASVIHNGFTIIVSLAIAAIQCTLVLLYFMHLRHEDRLLVKLIMPITMVTLAVFIGITFIDVISR